MADVRENVKNTTIKGILLNIDGMFEMVDERVQRIQLQMIRSQSSNIASGFVRAGEDGVDDAKIARQNLMSLKADVDAQIAAAISLIDAARTAHHDEEEIAINVYDQPEDLGPSEGT